MVRQLSKKKKKKKKKEIVCNLLSENQNSRKVKSVKDTCLKHKLMSQDDTEPKGNTTTATVAQQPTSTPVASVDRPVQPATGGMVVQAPDAQTGDIVIDHAAFQTPAKQAVPPPSSNTPADGLSLPQELSALHADILKVIKQLFFIPIFHLCACRTNKSIPVWGNIEQSLQRDINILAEPTSDRLSKRRALEKIQRETLGRASRGLDPRLATALLSNLCKPLLKCFSDPVEKCRELAIATIAG
jgi:hypothetical protein